MEFATLTEFSNKRSSSVVKSRNLTFGFKIGFLGKFADTKFATLSSFTAMFTVFPMKMEI